MIVIWNYMNGSTDFGSVKLRKTFFLLFFHYYRPVSFKYITYFKFESKMCFFISHLGSKISS